MNLTMIDGRVLLLVIALGLFVFVLWVRAVVRDEDRRRDATVDLLYPPRHNHARVALDDPATRPMQYWRDTTSLDAAEDRHRANGEES